MDFKTFVATLMGSQEQEQMVSIDIGSSKIKTMVLDISGEKPVLEAAGLTPTPANAIKNNVIVNPEHIGAAIRSLIDANEISLTKAVVSIPGPSVFTKMITTGTVPLKDLDHSIRFEASNYIPHNISVIFYNISIAISSRRY